MRAHRRGSIEHKDDILVTVIGHPRRQQRLRPYERKHEPCRRADATDENGEGAGEGRRS